MKSPWSESDIAYIKANFKTTKYKDLAVKFGVSTDAIKKLIRLKLKLSKPPKWTTEQKEILKAEYFTTPSKELAEKLGKEVGTMHQMANKFGLKCFDKMPDWSMDEIERLKELFPTHSVKELSIILNRPLTGVQTKCSDLGLNKSKEYRKAYLTINREQAIKALIGHTPWNKMEPVTLECKQCKEPFKVAPGRAKVALFCKKSCLSEWMKSITGEGHWHYTLVDRTCKQCGASFKCKPAKVKYGEGVFCSRNCLGSHTSKVMALHNGPTSIEYKMNQWLEATGIDFEPQYSIGPWVVDFYIPSLNLVIECDGDYWHGLEENKKRDRRKNNYLWRHGYNYKRFTETAINTIGPDLIKPLFGSMAA